EIARVEGRRNAATNEAAVGDVEDEIGETVAHVLGHSMLTAWSPGAHDARDGGRHPTRSPWRTRGGPVDEDHACAPVADPLRGDWSAGGRGAGGDEGHGHPGACRSRRGGDAWRIARRPAFRGGGGGSG